MEGSAENPPIHVMLFGRLSIHQIFGANTDVGKTILTTGLVRSCKHDQVYYTKPVSTGLVDQSDDLHVQFYAAKVKQNLATKCLFRFSDPVSPHLAARLALKRNQIAEIPSDNTLISTLAEHIRECADRTTGSSSMFVETAGGIHSPVLSGTAQADAYRPLFLPTILIGDSKLGGISTTISAYESLLLRGYAVDSVLIFRDEYYRNWEYLEPYFADRGIRVDVLPPPPPIVADDPSRNIETTEAYYTCLTNEMHTQLIHDHLDSCHTRRLQELGSMSRRTLDTIWWPFVQHGLVKSEEEVTVIDSAHKDFFNVYTPSDTSSSLITQQFDGSASWWTQTVGHANVSLTLAAARASGRYGHVMFPKATHSPALRLAERLVKTGPGKGWAARAFFSDNGSTGMEVAIKMALRAFSGKNAQSSEKQKKLGILGLKGSYHGDTIGAMDACEQGIYTCEWHDSKGFWLDPPTVGVQQGRVRVSLPPSMKAHEIDMANLSQVYDVKERIDTPLAEDYRHHILRTLATFAPSSPLAALVIEPLVLGAGGMLFVDPLFQRVLIDVAREMGLPVVFDEVFVGLYRLGMESTIALLGVNPDIAVYAKMLTGGLVPLAVTLASESVFRSYWSEDKLDSLLHGHSYTAHPVGCEVANETLDILDKVSTGQCWKLAQSKWKASSSTVWSLWDPAFVNSISMLPSVYEVMALGTVFVVKLREDAGGYASSLADKVFQDLRAIKGGESVHFRTLGNVAYFMTSVNTEAERIRAVERQISGILQCRSM